MRFNDKKTLKASATTQTEEVVPHDDGMHTYISVKFPIQDANNKPYAICGISTDITERKKTEEVIATRLRYEEGLAQCSRALLTGSETKDSIKNSCP